MSNGGYTNFNIDDDDDDVFIQPDIPATSTKAKTPAPKPVVEPLSQVAPEPINEGSGFLNFTNFVNPQNFINPLLASNNIQVKERQFTGGNTLDESVLTTLNRDLSSIGDKLLSILWPLRLRQKLIVVQNISNRLPAMGSLPWGTNTSSSATESGAPSDAIQSDVEAVAAATGNNTDYSKETIRKILDWDLWGPLIFVLGFSLIITYLQTRTLNAVEGQDAKSSGIFSASFTLIWAVLAVLSVNIQLVSPVPQKTDTGGLTSGAIALSFFQCVSILSYTLFPIILGGLFSIFIKWKVIRLVICTIMFFWSILCCWLILAIIFNCKTQGTPSFLYSDAFDQEEDTDRNDGDKRIFLMIYPVILVFGLFSWLCVIV